MWDNAPLLRSIANALFGISLALVLYGVARYVLQLPVFPLRAVELTAAPQRVPVEALEKVVREKVSGNFFTVDLEQTRQAFEQLPWVRKVSVRRKFPWSLEVEVEEQVVLARWNGTELVNTHGEVFAGECERVMPKASGTRRHPPCGEVEQVLPAFIGQPDSSLQVAQMYAELGAVMQPLQQQIVQLSLSPRYAWQVKLDDGMVIELGREEMQQRLARFVAVYPYSLAAMARSVRHVDLRYRNGFAVYLPGREV
ncbi:MAG TPA: cell division protein FtsQ [Gallionellaceae bacterium]|nr:cell division protein FtsQ [Gallionellaceae bacterium]